MNNLSKNTMLEMLAVMYRIRRFELKMQELFQKRSLAGDFLGALHSCEGQEAVAAGIGACLRRDDYVFSTHRGHGHAIAKGLDLDRMVAELLGKETGCSHGRGGSMHLFDPEIGLMGGNGIVGGGLVLALGTAYSALYRGTDQVTVCFFGDGALSQGGFHESLNMAALEKYPILYVCENNFYAATTHVSKNCPLENAADRAAAYGMPGKTVDGNDVLAVYEAASEAVRLARAGNGPTLIECKTYRHRAHCMAIREHRADQEITAWKAQDPIERLESKLLADGAATQDEFDRLQADVDTSLAQAVEFGKNSPFPTPDSVADGLWAD
ncbi:MAG: thiamine pyrophosphate-dependent dehydrogenase E1 component subunit alpha [Planctomycetota bacterium]